jgi:hypothetical protein
VADARQGSRNRYDRLDLWLFGFWILFCLCERGELPVATHSQSRPHKLHRQDQGQGISSFEQQQHTVEIDNFLFVSRIFTRAKKDLCHFHRSLLLFDPIRLPSIFLGRRTIPATICSIESAMLIHQKLVSVLAMCALLISLSPGAPLVDASESNVQQTPSRARVLGWGGQPLATSNQLPCAYTRYTET